MQQQVLAMALATLATTHSSHVPPSVAQSTVQCASSANLAEAQEPVPASLPQAQEPAQVQEPVQAVASALYQALGLVVDRQASFILCASRQPQSTLAPPPMPAMAAALWLSVQHIFANTVHQHRRGLL
jgi:hypothetical protein